jgi:hypothetical protein
VRIRIEYDTSEVATLAADLAAAPGRIQREAPRVLRTAAFRIKAGMRQDFSHHGHLPGLGAKVAYDEITPLFYEIGIDKGGQGSLGNVAAYGTSNNAPVADKNAALIKETPVVIQYLGNAGEDATLG